MIRMWGCKLRLKVPEVIELAKKFVSQQAGFNFPKILEVKSDEPKSQWTIIIDVGLFTPLRKEVVIDDKDGNVIGFK